MTTSISRSGLNPQNPIQQSKFFRLPFLSSNNFLPASDPYQVPATAHQISDLLKWAGCNYREMAEHLNCSPQSFKRWSQTKHSIEKNKLMPVTIWHYMTIILGLKEQPTIRRCEPSSTVTETYSVGTEQTFTFRAIINYNYSKVTIYNDSSLNEPGEELMTFPVHFVADQEKKELTINEAYRDDDCPLSFANENNDPTIDLLNDFVSKCIWPACWRLHDFHSLEPSMFLERENLLPLHHKDFKIPEPPALYRFCRWLGATAADIATLTWEDNNHMRYLVSRKAQDDYTNGYEKYAVDSTDSKKEREAKKKQLFNIRCRTRITAHGWNILTAAAGLVPAIQVIGRQDPRSRREKMIKIREIEGVPLEFIKISTVMSWTDLNKNELALTYAISTQKHRGSERTVAFKVNDFKGHLEMDSKLEEEGAPSSWTNAFVIDPSLNITDEYVAMIKKWFEKALWGYTWKFVYHGKMPG